MVSPRPSSLFKFGNLLIYIASLMPRVRSSLSFSTIFALSQFMTWFSFTEWSVRAEPHIPPCDCLFLSLVYTTALLTLSVSVWCSFTRTFVLIYPICTITSLGWSHAKSGGEGAKTTEVGTLPSPPCSNPSAAVLSHNKPVLKKSPGW